MDSKMSKYVEVNGKEMDSFYISDMSVFEKYVPENTKVVSVQYYQREEDYHWGEGLFLVYYE